MSKPLNAGRQIALRLFGMLMVGVAIVVSIWLGFMLSSLAHRFVLSGLNASLPQTSGVVISAGVEEGSLGRNRTAWRPVVTYTYTVAGTAYTSTVWRIHPFSFQQRADAERVAESYVSGQEVVVYYHPASPQVATLDRGYRTWDLYVSLIAAITIVPFSICIAPLGIESRMRKGHQQWLIDALLQRQPEPPRRVPLWDCIPAFYNPWVHLPNVIVVAVGMWAGLQPLRIAADGWIFFGIGALSITAVTVWPLYRFGALLWTLRYGYVSDASITAYTLHRNRYGRYARVTWEVSGAAGPFAGRFTIPYTNEWTLREGSRVRVLVHPRRPKVLRVLSQ